MDDSDVLRPVVINEEKMIHTIIHIFGGFVLAIFLFLGLFGALAILMERKRR